MAPLVEGSLSTVKESGCAVHSLPKCISLNGSDSLDLRARVIDDPSPSGMACLEEPASSFTWSGWDLCACGWSCSEELRSSGAEPVGRRTCISTASPGQRKSDAVARWYAAKVMTIEASARASRIASASWPTVRRSLPQLQVSVPWTPTGRSRGAGHPKTLGASIRTVRSSISRDGPARCHGRSVVIANRAVPFGGANPIACDDDDRVRVVLVLVQVPFDPVATRESGGTPTRAGINMKPPE